MSKYPEHEKLKAIQDRSQAIGEFIEWLYERDLAICEFNRHVNFDNYTPFRGQINGLLADHFGIDQNRLEAEKLAMLEEQRALNARVAARPVDPWAGVASLVAGAKR